MYSFALGSRFSGKKKAEVVRQCFEELCGETGNVEPEDVVSVATPASHPLHEFFEWDDPKAAHEYRLTQARTLIRSLKMSIIKVTPKTREVVMESVPAYINLRAHGQRDSVPYRDTMVVMNTRALRQQALVNAAKDAQIFARKYGWLTELQVLVLQINKFVSQVTGRKKSKKKGKK